MRGRITSIFPKKKKNNWSDRDRVFIESRPLLSGHRKERVYCTYILVTKGIYAESCYPTLRTTFKFKCHRGTFKKNNCYYYYGRYVNTHRCLSLSDVKPMSVGDVLYVVMTKIYYVQSTVYICMYVWCNNVWCRIDPVNMNFRNIQIMRVRT